MKLRSHGQVVNTGARVLLTGAGGFVGTNLLIHMADLGYAPEQLIAVDRNFPFSAETEGLACLTRADLSEPLNVREIFASNKFSHVIHLAANSDIRRSAVDPRLEIQDTLATTVNLVSSALEHPGLEGFFFSSSSAVFGDQPGELSETAQFSPASSYGWAKAASELAIASASESLARRILIFRFPNVVGRFSTHGVIHDLIAKLSSDDSYLHVLGDGSQRKPYVYAGDLVETITALFLGGDLSQGLQVLNVGPNDSATVDEIVSTLLNISGLRPKISYGDTRSGWPGDVPEYQFDVSKFETLSGGQFPSSISAISRAIRDEWASKE